MSRIKPGSGALLQISGRKYQFVTLFRVLCTAFVLTSEINIKLIDLYKTYKIYLQLLGIFSLFTGTKTAGKIIKVKNFVGISSHKFEGKRPFGTNLLWKGVNLYVLLKQRRLFLCAVIVLSRAAECAQPL
jgi:hypothetical protein